MSNQVSTEQATKLPPKEAGARLDHAFGVWWEDYGVYMAKAFGLPHGPKAREFARIVWLNGGVHAR